MYLPLWQFHSWILPELAPIANTRYFLKLMCRGRRRVLETSCVEEFDCGKVLKARDQTHSPQSKSRWWEDVLESTLDLRLKWKQTSKIFFERIQIYFLQENTRLCWVFHSKLYHYVRWCNSTFLTYTLNQRINILIFNDI